MGGKNKSMGGILSLWTWDGLQSLSRPWLVFEYDKCAMIKNLRRLSGKICKSKKGFRFEPGSLPQVIASPRTTAIPLDSSFVHLQQSIKYKSTSGYQLTTKGDYVVTGTICRTKKFQAPNPVPWFQRRVVTRKSHPTTFNRNKSATMN